MDSGVFHQFGSEIEGMEIPHLLGNPWGYEVGDLCQEAVRQLCVRLKLTKKERGKTFGVSVVQKKDGTVGWIAAFSGLLNGKINVEGFVPPIYDWTKEDGYFREEESRISMLKDASEKRMRSERLQEWLFAQYRVNNFNNERKNLLEIWKPNKHLPPGGTGECCAPKMIQYAISQNMKLIAMAEFRFEENGAIHYVPSCKDKCRSLLKFMLKGIRMKREKMMNGNREMSGRIERHPLGMFLPKDSRIMMLGSFPPKRNRWCMDFYYPNWLNDMWRIQGIVWYNDAHFFEVEGEKRFNKEKIIRFLKERKIALGDTATKVIRENDDSSDLHLKVVEKIDLDDVLEKATDLQLIISTGGKSAEMFCEIVGIEIVPKIGKPVNFKYGNRELTFCRMVSSSRAYPMKLEEKAKQYEFMRNFEDKLSREHNG